ncbi:hypothetical protein BGZ57DRAFT_766564, partial [Hyaloscypha finlandica]
APSQPAPITISNPTIPLTSLQDNSLNKRPRDARLMHMLLSSLGCIAYQERVPLQFLDFAYRCSLLFSPMDAPPGSGFREADGQVSANAVMLAIQSRSQYQFGGGNGGRASTVKSRNFICIKIA